MYKVFPCSDYYGLIWLPKGHRWPCFLARLPYHFPCGTPLDLSSSWCISSYMPRLDNSADSPQSHLYDCFAWTSMALQTSSVRTNWLSERYQHFRDTHPLWPIWFSVYASPILFT